MIPKMKCILDVPIFPPKNKGGNISVASNGKEFVKVEFEKEN